MQMLLAAWTWSILTLIPLPPMQNIKISGSSTSVCFNHVAVSSQLTTKTTKKSIQMAKVNTRKNLYDYLAQKF